MNYTLHQLLIFKTIADTKSITKAAELLHLTQPAVSIQLKKFQDQFDIPLTEVVGRRLFVTEFGLEIAQSAESILKESDQIRQRTLAFKGQLSGRLKFLSVSTGKYVMPYFLSGFMKQHRGVDLKMDVTNKSSVLKGLENNETDFALMSVLPENLKIETLKLMPNELHLIGRKGLAPKAAVSPQSLLEEHAFIFRENGSATRRAMESWLAAHNIKLNKNLELTSNEAVKQAVLAGLGFSVMPLIGLGKELEEGELKVIETKGLPIITDWHLVWLKQKKLSPAAAAYLEFVEKEKADIISRLFQGMKY